MNMKRTLLTLLCSLSLIQTAFAVDLQEAKAGDVIKVPLNQIHPTQTAIGYREVDYKINRFRDDRKKLFADYCESAGAKDVKHIDKASDLNNPDSFTCKTDFGKNTQEMKTVVIAPNNALYLTDGHHTLSVYDALSGDQVPVYVHITNDFRQLPSMKAFWAEMDKRNLVLLRDGDKTINADALPTTIGKQHMKDDEFRSIMYFVKDIGFKKPKNAPPFIEFYWENWLRTHIDLSTYQLNDKNSYADAVKAAALQMINVDKDTVIATINGQPYTAKAMGALDTFNNSKFNKLISSTGKITYALRQD